METKQPLATRLNQKWKYKGFHLVEIFEELGATVLKLNKNLQTYGLKSN